MKIPQLHRYIAGGTFGGPIIKDKLFGFLGYQHLHVSDQEIGDSFLNVPVGLTRYRLALRQILQRCRTMRLHASQRTT